MLSDCDLQALMAGLLHNRNGRLPRYFHFPGTNKDRVEDLISWTSTKEGSTALHAELTEALAKKQ